jgi:hypothetical protein
MGLLGEGISETMGFARGPGLIAGTIAGSPFAYQKAIPALLKGQQMAGEYLPEITRATTKSAFSVAPNIRPFTEEEKKMRALEQLSEDQSW